MSKQKTQQRQNIIAKVMFSEKDSKPCACFVGEDGHKTPKVPVARVRPLVFENLRDAPCLR